MNLRKTKVSIVTNAIFVLVASLFCILAIMDASKQLGYSYLPGLIAFGVFAVLGLILWKVFSLFASSDQVKAIFEKGDTLGLLVFAVLIIASIIFRVASYFWNGLGGNIYFDLAKVTGGEFSHYVHACDDWYIAGLHAIFFLFGNRIFIAAIFNCILQLASVVLGFFAFRKMLGIIPALFFAGFWTITGFSVHEALTLNSRNLVFLLIMLALFAISACVPATGGKFICYLVAGLLTAVCIYADIVGLVLLPFIVGIMLNDLSDEDTDFRLRLRKMLFTLISVIFGLVLLIFIDSFFSSSNPSDVLNAVLSLYGPSKGFTFGFTYLTSYAEVTIIAVIVSVGLFTCFLAENDSKTILLLSVIVATLINNFGLTYLENDGREIFFAFAALFAGSAFRELFPDQIQGDIFKASSEMYDNEFAAPDKGYVPAGVKSGSDLSADDFGDIGDGMTDTSDMPAFPDKSEASASETAKTAEKSAEKSAEDQTAEKKEDVFEYPAFDSAPIARAHAAAQEKIQPAQSAQPVQQTQTVQVSQPSQQAQTAQASQPSQTVLPAQSGSSQIVYSSTLSGPASVAEKPAASNVPRVHLSEAALAAKAARDAEAAASENEEEKTDSVVEEKNEEKTESKAETKAGEKQPEKPKTYSTYTYQKPQLRPEFRRRPGAWAQSYMDKDKPGQDASSSQEEKKEEKQQDVAAKKDREIQITKAPEKKPEIAPNGAVLLDNPIPHPARKTEHKNMEYDVNVDDSLLHYDINISDNDDYDV